MLNGNYMGGGTHYIRILHMPNDNYMEGTHYIRILYMPNDNYIGALTI